MTSKSKTQNSLKDIPNDSQDFLDDEIEEILDNITLNKPRNAYTHFCISEAKKLRKENKENNIAIGKYSRKWAEAWSKMNDNNKQKYNQMCEREKREYKRSIEIVRHFLFKDYNENVRRPATAYRIFLIEKMFQGFEKYSDPKKIKLDASLEWKKMSPDQKKVCTNLILRTPNIFLQHLTFIKKMSNYTF